MRKGDWEHDDETGQSTCSKVCSVTDELYSVTIDTSQYHQWMYQQRFIQDVAPELSVDDREFIISGITPAEWNEIFEDRD